jgi:hypothetical protein
VKRGSGIVGSSDSTPRLQLPIIRTLRDALTSYHSLQLQRSAPEPRRPLPRGRCAMRLCSRPRLPLAPARRRTRTRGAAPCGLLWPRALSAHFTSAPTPTLGAGPSAAFSEGVDTQRVWAPLPAPFAPPERRRTRTRGAPLRPILTVGPLGAYSTHPASTPPRHSAPNPRRPFPRGRYPTRLGALYRPFCSPERRTRTRGAAPGAPF